MIQNIFKKISPRFIHLAKFIFSGGVAAILNLATLYILAGIFYMHYLLSATIAFLCGVALSFVLQKFWTFEKMTRERIHFEVISYLIGSLIGLVLNTLFVYMFVEAFHIWYLMSQILSGIIIAVCNYFFYRHFVFKHSP
jgi:putative flippase GtrA